MHKSQVSWWQLKHWEWWLYVHTHTNIDLKIYQLSAYSCENLNQGFALYITNLFRGMQDLDYFRVMRRRRRLMVKASRFPQ